MLKKNIAGYVKVAESFCVNMKERDCVCLYGEATQAEADHGWGVGGGVGFFHLHPNWRAKSASLRAPQTSDWLFCCWSCCCTAVSSSISRLKVILLSGAFSQHLRIRSYTCRRGERKRIIRGLTCCGSASQRCINTCTLNMS